MAKKSNNEFTHEVIEYLGQLDNKETGWSKSIARIAWGDNPTTLDIRYMNIISNKMGKGISLTDEEADNVVNMLLEHDYGSIEALEKALLKKKKRFMINVPETIFAEDNKYEIGIE